jgi:alkylation response protein AidB-like acyl-CoA dehydrogenase
VTGTSQQDLDDLRAATRGFLQSRVPEDKLPLLADGTPLDTDLWHDMNAALGLHSLAIPEQFGGDGAGWEVTSVVFEELGRALAPLPYFSNFLAVQALLLSGDGDQCAARLPALAAAERRATVAVAEQDGAWDAALIRARATLDADGGWRITGDKWWVPDALGADLIVVFARTTAGPTLFAVEASDDGVSVDAMDVVDATRPLGVLHLRDAPAHLIGRDGGAGIVLSRLLDRGTVALAAEQVGLAGRCQEISVDYAKTRVQFGRPIGSFQAVKHLCAEMLAHVEMARAATLDAVRNAEGDDPNAGVAAAAAHITASAAAMFTAKETIQVLGGIGFTWDHPAHVYFRRAAASQLLFGGPAVSHERLLERLGI